MKTGQPHRVPLSPAALDILERAKPLQNETGLIFPSSRNGRTMSAIALQGTMKSAGLHDRATVHGFRSSFRVWAELSNTASHAAKEMSLAHAIDSVVERAYQRSDLLDQRKPLMTAWATFCTTPAEANILPFAATG